MTIPFEVQPGVPVTTISKNNCPLCCSFVPRAIVAGDTEIDTRRRFT